MRFGLEQRPVPFAFARAEPTVAWICADAHTEHVYGVRVGSTADERSDSKTRVLRQSLQILPALLTRAVIRGSRSRLDPGMQPKVDSSRRKKRSGHVRIEFNDLLSHPMRRAAPDAWSINCRLNQPSTRLEMAQSTNPSLLLHGASLLNRQRLLDLYDGPIDANPDTRH